MNRKTLTFLFFGAAALAVVAFTLDTAPVDAQSGCTDCGGPTLSVTGQGSGDSCAEALDNAETDALLEAFGTPAGCRPCQTSSGIQSCSVPSCVGTCPPNSYHATYTLNYKCRYCDFDPEIPRM